MSFFYILLLSGCSFSEWEVDKQSGSESSVIGEYYEATAEMGIYGIALNNEKYVDYYEIIENPGIAGRGVVTKDEVPIGAKIRVLRVEKCTNCWGFDVKRYVVSVGKKSSFDGKDVVVDKSRMDIPNSPLWNLVSEQRM